MEIFQPTIESKFHENKDWNILKLLFLLIVILDREQVPRKQGLKHNPITITTTSKLWSRASSTKTRIETITPYIFFSRIHRSRASSTKTRIETEYRFIPIFMLKRSRASSTKTRIETLDEVHSHIFHPVIESKFHENKDWNNVVRNTSICAIHDREQVPRKQGLKRRDFLNFRNLMGWSRASSTKTRIETKLTFSDGSEIIADREQVPRKQGLKRYYVFCSIDAAFRIESKFHENKDWNAW